MCALFTRKRNSRLGRLNLPWSQLCRYADLNLLSRRRATYMPLPRFRFATPTPVCAAPPSWGRHPKPSQTRKCRSYSITSSARTSNEGGTMRPSALAVFILITSYIDHQFEFGRLLYREIGRLGAFEDLIDVAGCTAEQI